MINGCPDKLAGAEEVIENLLAALGSLQTDALKWDSTRERKNIGLENCHLLFAVSVAPLHSLPEQMTNFPVQLESPSCLSPFQTLAEEIMEVSIGITPLSDSSMGISHTQSGGPIDFFLPLTRLQTENNKQASQAQVL